MVARNFITVPGEAFNASGAGAVERTVDDKLRDTVNVKDFGAVGDGVTDDASAIQATINSISSAGGGIVYFPEGTFKVNSTINVGSNITISGAGINSTIIKVGIADITTVNISASSTNVGLENLTINGNRAAFPSGTGIGLGGSGNISDLYLTNIKVTNGQRFSAFLNAGSGEYYRVKISNCVFEDSGDGYDTLGSGYLNETVIQGCIFRNTTGQGFATTNSKGGLIVSACTFEGPMGNGISLEPAQNVVITGCTFRNLNNGAIGIIATPVPALAATDPTDISVSGCVFENTGTVSGLLADYAIVFKNTSYSVISGNTISRLGRAGILLSAENIVNSSNSCKANTIASNTITDCNQDNAASTPCVLLQRSAGSFDGIAVSSNTLAKINADSYTTHGILESGSVINAVYSANHIYGHSVKSVGYGTGNDTFYDQDALPWLIDIDVVPTPVAQTNFNLIDTPAGLWYQSYRYSDGTQNAEVNFDLVLAEGTWTLELLHISGTGRGIYTALLDAVEVGTVDGYALSATNARGSITNIAVLASRKYRLKLKMATKNASSSGYQGAIQAIQLRRTA